ncbi:MAG TPA: recombinase family protein [Candidatus Tectomicrobia bacterium]
MALLATHSARHDSGNRLYRTEPGRIGSIHGPGVTGPMESCCMSAHCTHVKRPELTQYLKTLKVGDILVVWKFDRRGRSLRARTDCWTTWKRGVWSANR